MLLSEDQKNKLGLLRESPIEFMKKFGRDEDGGVIIMTLLLLVVMLVLGGMAVDFMRFESRRALLQSVSDRAVLAASDLSQTVNSEEVVKDFFRTQGFEDSIIGEPIASDVAGTRSVRVDSEVDVNTFYLRLIGIDELTAPARSAAVEGTGNVEVSMVLDISGSMNSWVSSAGMRRYQLMHDAATGFVDTLLDPEYVDQISLSLVAYSAHVSAGDEIFARLNTTDPAVSTGGVSAGDGTTTDASVGSSPAYVNNARCIDFTNAEYQTVTFDPDRVYTQAETFQDNGWGSIYSPTCPREDFQGIVALSQDADLLKETILDYRPTKTTSIHLGMKWGVSLLDPGMRDVLANGVSSVDPVFRGTRPGDYVAAGAAVQTAKYVVLMTDGQNVSTRRIRPEQRTNSTMMSYLSNWTYNTWRNNYREDGEPDSLNALTYRPTTNAQQDTQMQNICAAARDANIVVFTIAMGAPSHGEQEMRECASSDAHYFETEGGALVEIFDTIARQITDLRLTL